jgi:hypothetical protein
MIQESFECWQEADERDGEQTLEGGRTASIRFKASSVGIGIETSYPVVAVVVRSK